MRIAAALGWVCLSTAVFAQTNRDAAEWPRYGHDGALTGRSSLKGRISKPRVAWSYAAAGQELLLEITSAAGQRDFKFGAQETPAPGSRRVKAPERPTRDLDGSGTLRNVVETYHERWAKILPDVKGWQRVAWNQTWTDEKVCRLQLFAYDQGFDKPRMVWQTDPPEATIFQPLNIVYDLDGDGIQEICVAAHYRVMIFEGTTGRKESELRYHSSRPYGWFGLADVDGDGQMELVTIGDFQSHIDVLNYDPKKPEAERLSVRWRRDIEKDIEDRTKWPQVPPHPVVDVTGDGNPEIVLNLFNDSGDGQWHTLVLNAGSGAIIKDFSRQFLQGTADVNGDGKAELFLIGTDGALVPAFGAIELVSLGASNRNWSLPHGAWATADLPALGSNWSTTASQGMRQVLLAPQGTNKSPCFMVAQRDAQAEAPFPTTVKAMRLRGERLETIWQVADLPGDLQFVALVEEETGKPAVSIRTQLPQNAGISLACSNAEARVVEKRPVGVTLSTPIAARLRSNGPVAVIFEGPADQILALQPPNSTTTNAPQLLWRQPGRGMSDGSRLLGPVAADLDGDGGSEVIVASRDASGRALLVAYRHDGSCLWRTPFQQTPGLTPVWNVGALTFWWPGSFRDKGKTDLFVNIRRGLMHSDVGHLIDGRTGEIVWSQEKAVVKGQFNWGYAGIPPGVADLNGDGLDELVCLYPVCFWVADGRTGRITHGVELSSRKKLPAWAAYGEPMIYPFTGRGPEVLLDSQYILALLDTNGAPAWHGLGRADFPTAPTEGNVGQTTSIKHALADFDGDGVFEIASAGYGDGVRVINSRDGKVLWALPAPAATGTRVVSADIDGRKGDEILFVAGAKLIAVTGDRASGKILWEWQGPSTLSMPAIADTDADGLAEIIVQSADGTIHCIDQD